jgi:deazaflavin-dependent oxidoreductase (nitroreductase family)
VAHPQRANRVERTRSASQTAGPLWYRNLEAAPAVTVQVGAEAIRGRARPAPPAEKAALWPRMTASFPRYGELQAKPRREIPLVIVEPEPPVSGSGDAR